MAKNFIKFIVLLSLILLPSTLLAQSVITGKITDQNGDAVFLANIAVKGRNIGSMTNAKGLYRLEIPQNQSLEIVVSCIGYKTQEETVSILNGERRELNFTLETEVKELNEVSISVRQEMATTVRSLNLQDMQLVPTTGGSIESLIKTLPGVSSNNELSSQYSVRGGNFDENLVYVNDIEVYRPFLVRSGQQEGLSFINSDLISAIKFSAGGFDARYGDKMSSVLDIKYREPTEFGGSASVSLLGGSFHLEGASGDGKFSFLTGARYKTTAYILNTLETEGDYKPQFGDIQTLFNYKLNSKLEMSLFGNASLNQYNFLPQNRETEFGTANTPLNLVVYYEGNETDQFNTYLGAYTLSYQPARDVKLKFIASAFSTQEREKFDILGQYLINQLDNTIGSETFGDSILNIGIGSFLNHARNSLDARVYSASHVGEFDGQRHHLKWGFKYERQHISDRLSEWELIDSAGFSIPYNGINVELFDVIKARNEVNNSKITSFFQDTWGFRDLNNEFWLTAGLRASYITLSNEFLVSPRASFSIKPGWERDMMFHLSSGIYYQPPFYKEMRRYDGKVNRDLKSQRSIHLVMGGDYIFQAWDRPFKFTTEVYYKHLNNLVPYKIDNVRIRYAGDNMASGYATGIDFKINGEFVKDAESWASLSFMRTREDIKDDFYFETNDAGESVRVEPGFYPRPTDQFMTFGLYFQDYLPNSPDYKVHLNFLYGSRLPYSSPKKERFDQSFRLPSYRRVDLGFSKVLKKEGAELKAGNPLRHFKNIWLSAEIFNLLGINNTISYQWIRTVGNQQGIPGIYAVPNYLTNRRFNIKISAKF